MKKTTEKINTLQINSELWQRPEFREGGVGGGGGGDMAPYGDDTDSE